MRFGSVCSGIEAASAAWEPIGLKANWFAEIESFPSDVLAHHFPETPNLGDMTQLAEMVRAGQVSAPEVLVGGTPCFTAGHMVLTRDGYVPIEDIIPGQMVITHTGKLAKVARIGHKAARVGQLKLKGLPTITCTPDHPFLTPTLRSSTNWTAAKDMPGRKWCALGQSFHRNENRGACWHPTHAATDMLKGEPGPTMAIKHGDDLFRIEVVTDWDDRSVIFEVADLLRANGLNPHIERIGEDAVMLKSLGLASDPMNGYHHNEAVSWVDLDEDHIVYNIEVEEDHSYILNGAVVHNCQAFSIAGMRAGLSDPRGELTISYVRLIDAIDHVRSSRGEEPGIAVWENVPGVLSSADNAFGTFLAALAGEDEPLVPTPCPALGRSTRHWRWKKDADHKDGGFHAPRWSESGCVFGPKRTVSWRVLDAQFFGLAQRRRRVFVVASSRDGFDPAEVLLEFDGVRRDSPPRRESGESITHPIAPCLTSSGRGIERAGDTRGQDPVVAYRATQVSKNATARVPRWKRYQINRLAWSIRTANTSSVSGGVQEEITQALDATARPAIFMAFQQNTRDEVRFMGGDGQIVGAIAAMHGSKQQNYILSTPARGREPYWINGRQEPIFASGIAGPLDTFDYTSVVATSTMAALSGSAAHPVNPIAFSCKDYGADATLELSPTLRAMGHANSHANAGGQLAIAFALDQEPLEQPVNSTLEDEEMPMQVRRLMPVECERLQGFRDNWTAIIRNGKEAADGPRYKAIGNSMPVPVMRWIGWRIKQAVEAALAPADKDSSLIA